MLVGPGELGSATFLNGNMPIQSWKEKGGKINFSRSVLARIPKWKKAYLVELAAWESHGAAGKGEGIV